MGERMHIGFLEVDLAPLGIRSHVSLDGRELENVRALTIHTSVDDRTSVTLDLVQTRVQGRVEIGQCADGHEPIWFWCEACPLCAERTRAALPEDLPTG